MATAKYKFQKWGNDQRIEAAKRVTDSVINHILHLMDVHENNAIVVYSDTLSRQIPTSFAANAFNVFQSTMFRYELIRLCALWDKPDDDADTESIPTIIELIDVPELIEALAAVNVQYWASQGSTGYIAAADDDEETLRVVQEGLRLSNIQFGEEQVETARQQLAEAISASREITDSGKLATLRNLRNKHIAHALTASRDEKKGVAFAPRQPGDERDILDKTIPIVEKLHCWINGASFDLNSSRETDRKYAESLWRSCTFTIEN